MDKTEGLAIFLIHTKPATVIGGGGGFIDAGPPFALDDFGHVAENPARDWALFQNPWGVRNDGDLDRGEIFGVKSTPFFICPGKGGVVVADNPLSKLDFFRKEETFP
jgi:hypothetical protein